MTVLNEVEWTQEMINSMTLGKRPYETLCSVAKYYIHELGYSKRDTRNELERFLVQCDPLVSIVKWSGTIDGAISFAMKHKPVKIESIDITKFEMDTIDSLKGKQVKRLAFTLLCLSKYWDAVNGNDSHWVSTKDSEIMKMANINTSLKRQSLMYGMLSKAGLIRFSNKVDNVNIQVIFTNVRDDSKVVLNVTDLRNLGYQYLSYHGGSFFVCENCGITTKMRAPSSGRTQKYCQSCADEIKIKQSIDSVMRHRKRIRPPRK